MITEQEQRREPLANLPPLVPLEFFAVALGRDMRSLIDDCDSGKFGHCWDISASLLPPAPPRRRGVRPVAEVAPRYRRRELRVFNRDGLAVLYGDSPPRLTYEECLETFIPSQRSLRGTELQKLWCCGPDLVHDLGAAGLIVADEERVEDRRFRPSRFYTRESIVNFLNLRALGDPRKN